MPRFNAQQLRNVALLSHGGVGKTSIAESMLFDSGGITRLGRTDDGTSTSDYEPEAQKRGASTQASILPCVWNGHKVNIIDTPGYADFRGEVTTAVRVADGAIMAVSAPSGVEVGTVQMWQMAVDHGLPRIVFVNKMDRENTDFRTVMDSITESLGRECVALQVPVGSEEKFSHTISLMHSGVDVPDELEAVVNESREKLIEAISEVDDDLMMKYLEGETLSQEELTSGLKKGVISGAVIPVLFGAATLGIGISDLMTTIIDLMPSPGDASGTVSHSTDSEEDNLSLGDESASLAALVFKTAADPFVGKLSYIRVYSGTLQSDSQVWNATRGETERIGQVYVVTGKDQEPVDGLAAGDIGTVAKMASVLTGDTLSEKRNPKTLPGFVFPTPVYQMATYPKSKADLDKITTALARITEEDPSLSLKREPDTSEMLLSGLGDVHVEVAVEKMKRKFGVEIDLQVPTVPYKETVTTKVAVEYKHKKQSGGHGQYAHVLLEVEPLSRGAGFEFAQKVVGGSVPREYIPSVEKGCRQALGDGVLAGFPVVDLRATLFDGSYHTVDSSGMSFEIAGGHALLDGLRSAGSTLLEPIMRAEIAVPETDTGDVMGDLNGRRARILGMNPQSGGVTVIEAEVPQAEMLRYATELRSQTQGRGTFTMVFDHYDPVPGHLVKSIVESKESKQVST